MTDSIVVDRSLIVLPRGEGRLSVQMLAAYNRPRAGIGVIAATWLFMDLASLDEMCED